MTVPSTIARAQYSGTGSTGPFAFNFKLFDTSHIKVVKTSTTGVDTTLTLTTDYSVSLAADFSNAAVTLVTTLAVGEKLTLLRNPPQSQAISWPANDPFPSATHERAADLAVMLIQALSEVLGRIPTLADSSIFSNLTFPDPSANKFIGWNSAGLALENKTAAALGAVGLPASSTDNALVRFDGTTGDTFQNSTVIVDDLGNVSGLRYQELLEIAEPASPSVDRARFFAFDDGLGITIIRMKDSAGNVSDISHVKQTGTGAVTRAQYLKLREFVSVKDFGAVGNGVADDSAAINNAITAAASGSTGKILVPLGTYLAGANPFKMQPGIELIGEGPGSILKQANAANLNQVVDFSVNNAQLAKLRNLVVDGNRTNNTGRLESGINATRIVYYGNVNNVTIDNCAIQNSPGYGVHGSSQSGLVITNNRIENCEAHTFFCSVAGGNFDADMRIQNNYLGGLMLVQGINNVLIQNNLIVGRLLTGTVVNITGTTVTWVSGPTFANVRKGDIIVAVNGTVQKSVKTIESTTSLTLDSAPGNQVGVAAIFGENDLLGVGGCRRCVVSGNHIRNGASFGISLFGDTLLESVLTANNIMFGQGIYGWALLGSAIGAQNIMVENNYVGNCCLGGDAARPAATRNSYFVYKDGAGTISRVSFSGNFAQDNAGNTHAWLGCSGLAAGTILIGHGNAQVGATASGIDNGISSVTLGAGWGATATVTNIRSDGNAMMLTITANGAGIAANPSVTVNTVAAKVNQGNTANQNPYYLAKMVGGTGTIAPLFNEHTSTPNAAIFNYLGTPVAGNTYQIQVM